MDTEDKSMTEVNKSRRNFLIGAIAAATAAAIPIKLTLKEKAALKSNAPLPKSTASKIEKKLIAAVERPKRTILEDIRDKQERCSHLKGGRYRRKTMREDYNVAFHTFIDGSRRIWCMSCFKKWAPEDADWTEAMRMFMRSTNQETSSEVVMPNIPEFVKKATRQNPVFWNGRWVYGVYDGGNPFRNFHGAVVFDKI
jgi:hypothetical protein